MQEIFSPDFFEMINTNFSDLDSAIVKALSETDERYIEMKKQVQELSDRFPVIESILEGKGPITISDKEHAGLTEYLELIAWMEHNERLAIYYAGHKDCFAYLKRVGAFK